jgi:hypothetical protein
MTSRGPPGRAAGRQPAPLRVPRETTGFVRLLPPRQLPLEGSDPVLEDENPGDPGQLDALGEQIANAVEAIDVIGGALELQIAARR